MSTSPYQGVEAYVGRTPLIRLRRLSELTGCEILGKAEFLNLLTRTGEKSGTRDDLANAETRGEKLLALS